MAACHSSLRKDVRARLPSEVSAFNKWVGLAQSVEQSKLEEVVISCRQSEMFQKKGTAPQARISLELRGHWGALLKDDVDVPEPNSEHTMMMQNDCGWLRFCEFQIAEKNPGFISIFPRFFLRNLFWTPSCGRLRPAADSC